MKMTKIVRTTADVFFPFCLAFGLYVVIHGHQPRKLGGGDLRDAFRHRRAGVRGLFERDGGVRDNRGTCGRRDKIRLSR